MKRGSSFPLFIFIYGSKKRIYEIYLPINNNYILPCILIKHESILLYEKCEEWREHGDRPACSDGGSKTLGTVPTFQNGMVRSIG